MSDETLEKASLSPQLSSEDTKFVKFVSSKRESHDLNSILTEIFYKKDIYHKETVVQCKSTFRGSDKKTNNIISTPLNVISLTVKLN